MKLRLSTIEKLADMVVGDNKLFPYRSSSAITSFFRRCNLPHAHDGSTRRLWAKEVLETLNEGTASSQELPADDILQIFSELLDEDDFRRSGLNPQEALADLNSMLARDGLVAYIDAQSGSCFIKNTGSGLSSESIKGRPRPLTKEEIAGRDKVAKFLDSASEDEFTEKLLVPLFQRLGFHRISPGGHKEKIMEYGNDLWMKYPIPTGHWLYFCAQIKKGKIDSSGVGGSNNVANILAQIRMAIDYPIFDPDLNKKVLLDHMFVIAGGEITRAARNWLIQELDAGHRRHILFMDRTEFLDHSARILQDLQLEEDEEEQGFDSTIFADPPW